MSAQTEFDGDQCVVLPKDYLKSPAAASEIYEEELARVATNLDVENWKRVSFFKGTLLAALLWTVPVAWTVCL